MALSDLFSDGTDPSEGVCERCGCDNPYLIIPVEVTPDESWDLCDPCIGELEDWIREGKDE